MARRLFLYEMDLRRLDSLTIQPPPSVVMSQYTWTGGPCSPPTYTVCRPELVSPFSRTCAQSFGRLCSCPTGSKRPQ